MVRRFRFFSYAQCACYCFSDISCVLYVLFPCVRGCVIVSLIHLVPVVNKNGVSSHHHAHAVMYINAVMSPRVAVVDAINAVMCCRCACQAGKCVIFHRFARGTRQNKKWYSYATQQNQHDRAQIFKFSHVVLLFSMLFRVLSSRAQDTCNVT